MKKIIIFSHNYLYNNWKTVIEEQLQKLLMSDLYLYSTEINYCVYSEEDATYSEFLEIIKNYDSLNKINIIRHSVNEHEVETIYYLQQRVNSLEEDYNVLYYHTKGVTSELNHSDQDVNMDCVTSWRHLLEYFNIERWSYSIDRLEYHDISGVLYIGDSGQYYQNYYSGNFWWARSSYIKTLPNIKEVYAKQLIENSDLGRMMCEKWIGMSPHNWFSFYSQDIVNIYTTFFEEKLYKKTIEKKDILIIVDGYINSDVKEKMMIDCINSFKKTDCKVMSISHNTLSKEIQNISDYVFTDKSNVYFKNNNKKGIKTFTTTDKFLVENYFKSELYTHVPNVLIGIYNAVQTAKMLGYKYFFCTSYDFILDEKDIDKFNDMIKHLYIKEGVFFGSKIPEQNEVFLSTHTLCSCDYFLNNILPIKNEDDWWNNCSMLGNETYAIEIYLGANLKNKLKDIKILNFEASKYFTNSNTNLISSGPMVSVVRMLDKLNNRFYPNIIAFVYNSYQIYNEFESVKINVYKKENENWTNVFSLNETIKDGNLHFTLFEMEYNIDYKIITYDTKMDKENVFIVNTNNINEIDKFGYMKLFQKE